MFTEAPRFTFATDQARYALWVPAKGLVLQRVSGRGDGNLVRALTEALDGLVAEGTPIGIFDDFEELEGYDREARSLLTVWTKKNWASVRALHILVRSRVVAAGVSVANVAFGGSLRSYVERARFEAAFKVELDQARTAARKA